MSGVPSCAARRTAHSPVEGLTMGTKSRLRLVLACLVILAGCSRGPGSTGGTQATATAAVPAARTISGQVSYSGSLLGSHKIVVVVSKVGEQGPPAASTILTKPGPYSLTGVADGTYVILAFIDLGDDMGAPGASEPQGSYDKAGDGTADQLAIQGGAGVTGVDITLKDR